MPPVRRGAALLAATVLAGSLGVGCAGCAGSGSTTITAEFPSAPGLFAGNHVDVLGLPVGTVEKVTPYPDHVEVVMTVRGSQKIPVGATAVLMAPGVVNDRFVQLEPAYGGGPFLRTGDAPIPESRTAVPLTTDAIVSTLDNLVRALGPTAEGNGSAATALHQLADALRGNGTALHQTIVSAGRLLDVLAQNGTGLAKTLQGADGIARTLADNDALYTQLTGHLAEATQALAADSPQLGAVLSSLQQTLGQVVSFVAANKTNIASIVTDLQQATAGVSKNQSALVEMFDTGALSMSNFAATVDSTYPYGPVERARFDPVGSEGAFVSAVCGDQAEMYQRLLRLVLGGSGQPVASPVDLACSADASLAAETPPPGAPDTSNITLASMLAADGSR